MTGAVGGTLFVAHGSPTVPEGGLPIHKFLTTLGQSLPRPKAILCISSHWETPEPCLTATKKPETLVDYGRAAVTPQMEYRCHGDPILARRAAECLQIVGLRVTLNYTRGIDHAVWDPMRCMCPLADVPVVEMSIQTAKPAAHHYEVGQALAPLTQEGYLVVGSGLAVHNLKQAAADVAAGTPIWAHAFDDWLRTALLGGRYDDVIDYRRKAPFANLAHPTPEHILPLIIALGAAGPFPRAHAINIGFGFTCISQACYYFQCQSDSLDPDPVLGLKPLPSSKTVSGPLSKRVLSINRPKTKRKTLASCRTAQVVVSDAHLSALQQCVLEQSRGVDCGAKKSPLEERLESVLAAKQATKESPLVRSTSWVSAGYGNPDLNPGLAQSVEQKPASSQGLLETLRAQVANLERAGSGVEKEFLAGVFQHRKSRDAVFLEGAFQSDQPSTAVRNELPDPVGVCWADTSTVEPGSLNPGFVNPELGVQQTSRGPGVQLAGHIDHVPSEERAQPPGGVLRALEALFEKPADVVFKPADNEPDHVDLTPAQSSGSSSAARGPAGQNHLESQNFEDLLDGFRPTETGPGNGWRRIDLEGGDFAGQSGGEAHEAVFGAFTDREETSAHQPENPGGGIRAGGFDGSRLQGGGEMAGVCGGGALAPDAESSLGDRGMMTWGENFQNIDGSDLPVRKVWSSTPKENAANAERPQANEGLGVLGSLEDPMVETERGAEGGATSDWLAEQEYAADAMLAGMSQPDWWLWADLSSKEIGGGEGGPASTAHAEEPGDCYPVSAAQETAAEAMLGGMSQPDWWAWANDDGL